MVLGQNYRVIFQIEVAATTALDAAIEAQELLRFGGSWAFEVLDLTTNVWTTVDLDEATCITQDLRAVLEALLEACNEGAPFG